MILAVDVQYWQNQGYVAAVAFNDWQAAQPDNTYQTSLTGIAEYEPGQFYKRELPCILQLLHEYQLQPELIIVDGYVTLNSQGTAGLGTYLYQSLGQKTNIIGIAKRAFFGISEDTKILRGKSKSPLFVTSIGIELAEAKALILNMHGEHRIPTLLKLVDSLCREKAKEQQLTIL